MMRGAISIRNLVLLAALGCVACPSANDDGVSADDDDDSSDDDDFWFVLFSLT